MSQTAIAGTTIGIIALITWICRGFPYLVFSKRKKLPPIIDYLGTVFPSSIMIILVVYCLRNTQFGTFPYGLPEMISVALVVGLQVWKKNTLLSILLGTVCYMILIRTPLFA